MSTLEEQVAELQLDVAELQNALGAFVQFGGQTQISGSVQFLGPVDIRAGRFLALSNGTEPTAAEASGVFMSAEGEVFGDDIYNIGGVNEGILKFGLNSTTGAGNFGGGAGVIDENGITLTGLRTGIAQLATAGGAVRYGVLETFVPEGATTPAFGMSLSDNDDPTANVLVNGDFETGDLTGWTQSGASFSAELDAETSTYHLACAEITGVDEEIVSDRIAVTEASKLAISVKTKDTLTDTSATCPCVADTYIKQEAATTNFGTETVLVSEPVSATAKRRLMMKFDLSTLPAAVYDKPAFEAKFRLYCDSLGTAAHAHLYSIFALNKNWVEAEATWNIYKTASNWATAGIGGLDHYSGLTYTVGPQLNLGWNEINKNPAGQPFVSYYVKYTLNGTYAANYGVYLVITSDTSGEATTLSSREGANPPELVVTWQEPSDYEIVVRWYDDASAGTLLRTDVIAVEDNLTSWNTHTANLSAPAGALSAEVVVVAHAGQPFYIDDVSVVITTILQRIYLDDNGAHITGNADINGVTTLKEIADPASPSAGYRALYAKSDGLYQKVPAGTVSRLALASEIPTLTYPDGYTGSGASFVGYTAAGAIIADDAITTISSNIYGGVNLTSTAVSAANGVYYLLNLPLAAGTYSISINVIKGSNFGKFDLYMDGVKKSATTLDCYAASTTWNQEWAITGVVIATGGWHVVKILTNEKNASSADYRFGAGAVIIHRTG